MVELSEERAREIKEPSYLDALIPLVALVVLIGGAVALFGVDAVDGPIPVALILSGMVVALVALKNGYHWEEVVSTGKIAFESIVTPIFILLAVGSLIGTWNMSGTIPTLVYYGIQVLQPGYFYVATLVVCALISLSIGSSWTTAGTIGVGLVGLASLVGVSPAVTAGAVISGAYLGDKLSPLSETTVLTSQLVGLDIYTHLRHQIWTSVPAFLIALVVLGAIGLRTSVAPGVDTGSELNQLDKLFWITPWNLIPLAVLIVLSIRKVPASLAIMSAALLAALMAPFFQHDAIVRFIDDEHITPPLVYIKAAWVAIATGFEANSGIDVLDRLLSRGGMASMLTTLWIIIGAVTFGTMLDEFKLLAKLINPLLNVARSTGRLIGSVVGVAFGLNVLAADQYIALVLPARLFHNEFEKRGLGAANLSRACADGGTVTSALVPWNSCGAFMAATLGVPTLAYAPFCLFNIASPLLSILWGIIGFKIARQEPVAGRVPEVQVAAGSEPLPGGAAPGHHTRS
jgi:NhaC family Na+:H+ antiporter